MQSLFILYLWLEYVSMATEKLTIAFSPFFLSAQCLFVGFCDIQNICSCVVIT